jgi:gas vesicle protein
MGGNTKFLAGLIAGAAAGAAIAMFLNSEAGKEIIADIKDAAGKAFDDLKEKVKNAGDEENNTVEGEFA